MNLGSSDSACDGNIELDAAVAVLEQGDGELDRQAGGVGAVVFRAEGQLVDIETVFGLERLVFNQVMHVEGQLAFLERAADDISRRRERRR